MKASVTKTLSPGAYPSKARTSIDRVDLRTGRENIGITDDFFAMGGDSIRSLELVARARSAGLRITPKQIFEL